MEKGKITNINWPKLEEIIENSAYDQTGLSKLLGMSKSWFSSVKSNGRGFDEDKFNLIKAILNVTDEDVLLKEDPVEEQIPLSLEGYEEAPEGVFTASVLSSIAELSLGVHDLISEVKAMKESLVSVEDFLEVITANVEEIATTPGEKPVAPITPAADKDSQKKIENPVLSESQDEAVVKRAARVLEDMLAKNKGKLRQENFYGECLRRGIGRVFATQAVKAAPGIFIKKESEKSGDVYYIMDPSLQVTKG